MRVMLGMVLLLGLASTALARPPGNFGFGPPPSYLSLTDQLRISLSLGEDAPLEVSRPVIGCKDRGHPGRADVCGYQFCVRARGRSFAMWSLQGYGLQVDPQTGCSDDFTSWSGDPPVDVLEFCDVQPRQGDCKKGIRESLRALTLDESTGATERARRAQERTAQLQAETDRLRAEAQARADAEQSRVQQINSVGPLRAYPALAGHRYRVCQRLADAFLDGDVKEYRALFESGLESIRSCAIEQEKQLAEEVRLALARAPASARDAIKDLHAYSVASIRSLTNFHQSVIEARQARAERMAGIDERATRVELEIP